MAVDGLALKIASIRVDRLPLSFSTSKEALTKELHDNVRVIDLPVVGTQQQCTMSILSKELSSLLAIDAKKMIECLTDLFDDHDIWEYKTKGGRSDKLYNPGLNMFAARQKQH